MENLKEIIEELSKIPKGKAIEAPDELVAIEMLFFGLPLYFTRRSLKHMVEKGGLGRKLMELIFVILYNPDEIRSGTKKNRYLVLKTFNNLRMGKPFVVCLEQHEDYVLIITVFPSHFEYLKNYDLLWRTAIL